MIQASGNVQFICSVQKVSIYQNSTIFYFLKTNSATADTSANSFWTTAGLHLVMILIISWGYHHFFSVISAVNMHFVFHFTVFHLDVNAAKCWQYDMFQIPFWGSCPLLTDQKTSLITLARCDFCVNQTQTDSSSRYGVSTTWEEIIITICWQHDNLLGLFQITFLKSHPFLIAQKILLISLIRFAVSASIWYGNGFFF